ncbi:NAD(P)/FAD-dependent oxidoreductase [Candidatus Paracaedibacter symbiosus]|uniref:NAD(P)/FAD-dependent oxidoreductase n=1 Tax=Candidatus Paracaedibacter symbiosus TaxID=244582 RepID=UPI000509DF58|nr:FAD-dependent oxidoreductase [Candidatus Paracaedibacter symbiosus]
MTYDITIIGNGILGLSTALSLAFLDPSLKIGVVGPENKEGGASVAAGAMLNAFAEITSTSLKSYAGQEKFNLSIQASKRWDSWIKKINDFLPVPDQITYQKGTFLILNSKSGILDSENFYSILKALNEHNEPYEEVNPAEIPGLHPLEDCRPLRSLYLPNEGCIDSGKFMRALQDIATNHYKISFINKKAKSFNVRGNSVTSINIESGESISSKTFVLAMGSYSQKLIDTLPQISRNIPRLLSGMGCSLVVNQDNNNIVQHVIRTPNRSGACGLHAMPQGEGNLYIGATNNVYMNPKTHHKAGFTHFLLECALEQINQNLHKSDIKTYYTGNRPATIDTFPLIGETSINGLWLLTGTYRDGFHQSPFLGDSMARKILGLPHELNNIFKPERSLIKTFTKEESIEEAIRHYMCGAYERSMKLPKAGWDEVLRDLIHNRVNYVYDRLETNFGLSPDMMMMFEFSDDFEESLDYFKDYFKGNHLRKNLSIL